VIGKTVSHYKIISKLGEGGMGVVYKAQDTRLDRPVAIKFLPPQLSTDSNAKKRFIREAKAASALNHANIAVVHEIDETSEGGLFMVMAYYEGQTLRDRIEQGAIAVDDAIAIVTQVASGLAKAHEKGILHRDIKPGNILMGDDRQAKLADFGLARLAGQTKITKTGTAVGTVAYMSPEQARGEDIDAASDVFALGIVFYEMLTGVLPFDGDNEAAVIYGIMHEEPEPAGNRCRDLPRRVRDGSRVEDILRRCLAKQTEKRYQNAGEMLNDLIMLASGSGSGAARRSKFKGSILKGFAGAVVLLAVIAGYLQLRHATGDGARDQADPGPQTPATSVDNTATSIAVLPFVNLSADAENEYFSDGLTEDLIYALAKTDLRVVSRTSTFQFKNRVGDVRDIGHTLGVRAVLEGTVRKSDRYLVITVRMVNVSDGYEVWSGRFERKISDIFAIQNEISRTIVNALELKMPPEQEAAVYKRYTENLEAYNTYLKGRYYWNIRSPDALRRAIELFKNAIELDRGYALAYAGLADAYLMAANYEAIPPDDAYRAAMEAALQAIELDDKLAEAHASMGLLEWIVNWDWKKAEEQFGRAVSLRSAYATTYHWHSLFLAFMGRTEDAIEEINYAVSVDPVSHNINAAVALLLYVAGDFDAAIQQADRTLEMRSDFFPAHTVLAKAYAAKGMYDEAIRSMRESINISGRRPSALAWLGHIYARAGRTKEALDLVEELESEESEASDFDRVVIHAGLRQGEEALRWLEKAYLRPSFEIFTCQTDPMLSELRNHPQYASVMERTGFPVP